MDPQTPATVVLLDRRRLQHTAADQPAPTPSLPKPPTTSTTSASSASSASSALPTAASTQAPHPSKTTIPASVFSSLLSATPAVPASSASASSTAAADKENENANAAGASSSLLFVPSLRPSAAEAARKPFPFPLEKSEAELEENRRLVALQKSELEAGARKRADLLAELFQLSNKLVGMKADQETVLQDVEQRQASLSQLQDLIKEGEAKYLKLLEDFSKASAALTEKQRELDDLAYRTDQANQYIASLSEDINRLTSVQQRATADLEEAKKSATAHMETTQTALQEARQQMETMETDIRRLTMETAEANAKRREATSALDQVLSILHTKQIEADRIGSVLADKSHRLEDVESRLAAKEEALRETTEAHQLAIEEKARLDEAVALLRGERESLERIKEELRDDNERETRILAQARESAKIEREQWQRELARFEEQKQTLREELDELDGLEPVVGGKHGATRSSSDPLSRSGSLGSTALVRKGADPHGDPKLNAVAAAAAFAAVAAATSAMNGSGLPIMAPSMGLQEKDLPNVHKRGDAFFASENLLEKLAAHQRDLRQQLEAAMLTHVVDMNKSRQHASDNLSRLSAKISGMENVILSTTTTTTTTVSRP